MGGATQVRKIGYLKPVRFESLKNIVILIDVALPKIVELIKFEPVTLARLDGIPTLAHGNEKTRKVRLLKTRIQPRSHQILTIA